MRDYSGDPELVRGDGRDQVLTFYISGSRPASPVVSSSSNKDKKKLPVFIPRARSRSRNVSGSPMRSSLLESKLEPRYMDLVLVEC